MTGRTLGRVGPTTSSLGGFSARLIFAAVAVISIASCGSGSDTVGAAASSEVSAALDRMAALRSVRIMAHATGPNTTNDIVTTDFEPPDRAHTVQSGTENSESFYIGSTVYQSEPGRPGYFRPVALPANGPPRNLLAPLQSLKGASASKKGDTYRVAVPGGSVAVAIRVQGGYITEFSAEAAGVRTVESFSLFDRAPAVVEPSADHLLPALPTAPECKSDQPVALCLNSGPLPSVQPVELPTVPPGFSGSNLQVRPVTSDGTDCATSARNPEPSSAVRLNDSTGHCYVLGASELTVPHAEVTPVREQFDDKLSVEFKLDAHDAAAFDQLARRYIGMRVAIVMFGRVLSAPVVQSNHFQGSGQINGLDPTTAAEVVASLSR